MATATSNDSKTDKLNSSTECDEEITHPFSVPSADSDLILLVEERELHVSKLVLSLASPVFKRMFEADFKEKSCTKIPLPGKKFADMLEFLLCVYPSTCTPVTLKNLNNVLPLAHEYQVKQLVDRCEAYILNRLQNENEELENLPIKVLVFFLFLADKYDLQLPLKLCIEKMAFRNYMTGNCAVAVPIFKLVSVNTKFEILNQRMRGLEPIAKRLDESCRYSQFQDYFRFEN